MSNHDANRAGGSSAAESELYLALGQQLQEVQEDAAANSGLESLQAMTEGRESVADLVKLGQAYFNRISASAYNVVCGSADGSEEWKTLHTQGQTALIGAIAALLVAHLAIMATVASAVAAVIVKVFYDAASKELCSSWKAGLSGDAS